MGMTIDGSIKELSKWRNDLNYDNGDYFYGDDTTRHSLGVAIEIMRKYKKIQEIVKKWELDSWTDNLSYESMIQIREVLEDGNENNHYASNS